MYSSLFVVAILSFGIFWIFVLPFTYEPFDTTYIVTTFIGYLSLIIVALPSIVLLAVAFVVYKVLFDRRGVFLMLLLLADILKLAIVYPIYLYLDMAYFMNTFDKDKEKLSDAALFINNAASMFYAMIFVIMTLTRLIEKYFQPKNVVIIWITLSGICFTIVESFVIPTIFLKEKNIDLMIIVKSTLENFIPCALVLVFAMLICLKKIEQQPSQSAFINREVTFPYSEDVLIYILAIQLLLMVTPYNITEILRYSAYDYTNENYATIVNVDFAFGTLSHLKAACCPFLFVVFDGKSRCVFNKMFKCNQKKTVATPEDHIDGELQMMNA